MKALVQLVAPTVKAIFTVVGFMVGLGWGAYSAVEAIAVAQGQVIEGKMMAIRNTDYQHFDKRFDRTDEKLDKIMSALENRRGN